MVLQLDDDLLEQQREAYKVQGVDESEPAQPSKKRKKEEYVNGEEVIRIQPDNPKLPSLDTPIDSIQSPQDIGGRVAKKKAKPSQEPRERQNKAIYVTALPPSTTTSELQSVFSRCGVIAEEIDSGKPRIKLYTDESGAFKGDALIVFFRAESVDLAVQLLDDTELRLGEGTKMKVAAADFSYKVQKDRPVQTGGKDKRKIIKKTQKLNKSVFSICDSRSMIRLTENSKLADWDDDDPQALQDPSSKWDKVVILKHMFTLKELEVCRVDFILYLLFALGTLILSITLYRKTQEQFLISKRTFERNARRLGP